VSESCTLIDGVSKAVDHHMRLFLGEQYLRLQTPLHCASENMDDASRGDIRKLKQMTRELIKRETEVLHHFMAFE